MGTPVAENAPEPEEAPRGLARAETFEDVRDRLGWLERFNIAFVRATFEIRWLNRFLLWGQRVPGVFWVHHCTKHIRHVVGIDRVSGIGDAQGVVLASNHRSFFDMFVVNMELYRHGFRQRLLFPVRSSFFYDNPLGLFVNGIMSWFSMYPPIFRDRKRIALNHVAMAELARALQLDNRGTGMHPEGRRNLDPNPYKLLTPQAGIGRLIHLARPKVIPIFINGLGNELYEQIKGNFTKKGTPIVVVYGAPIDFGELLDEPPTAKTYRAIAERLVEEIEALGEEERAYRAKLEGEAKR